MDYLQSFAQTGEGGHISAGPRPIMIADTYLMAKINTIRLASLRGYKIPDHEAELVRLYTEEDREQALDYFIDQYIVNQLLNVMSLSQEYELDTDRVRQISIGSDHFPPTYLHIIFYMENSTWDSAPDFTDSGIIVVSNVLNNASAVTLTKFLHKHPYKFINIRSLDVYPFGNALMPQCELVADPNEVQALASQRDAQTPFFMSRIHHTDPAAMYLGAEVGHAIIQTIVNVDRGAVVSHHLKICFVD